MVTSKALSLFDNFNQLTPYAVGYDRVFDQLQKYVTNNVQSSGFPPYNIQKGGDYNYTIEIALAGFSKDDLEIEKADGVLSIRSTKESSDKHDDEFTLHRGISYRKFNRKFTLAEDVEVIGASLKDDRYSRTSCSRREKTKTYSYQIIDRNIGG